MLTGAQGQVGWELARSLQPIGEVVALDKKSCDLSQPETLPALVHDIRPDVIVNAAAYTAVDKAEDEEGLATTVNAQSVGILAEEARKADALMVHYSTDYVFSGTKSQPYTEDDAPDPVNVYGRSKLAGERYIQESGARHVIFRTSWVYTRRRNNFIKTIQRLAAEKDSLNVVADQIGAPTSAELIADVTLLSLYRLSQQDRTDNPINGIYNLTPRSHTSWYDLAVYIVKEMLGYESRLKLSPENIHPIAATDYPTKAARPANSRLDVNKLEAALGIILPTWDKGVSRTISDTISCNS